MWVSCVGVCGTRVWVLLRLSVQDHVEVRGQIQVSFSAALTHFFNETVSP